MCLARAFSDMHGMRPEKTDVEHYIVGPPSRNGLRNLSLIGPWKLGGPSSIRPSSMLRPGISSRKMPESTSSSEGEQAARIRPWLSSIWTASGGVSITHDDGNRATDIRRRSDSGGADHPQRPVPCSDARLPCPPRKKLRSPCRTHDIRRHIADAQYAGARIRLCLRAGLKEEARALQRSGRRDPFY